MRGTAQVDWPEVRSGKLEPEDKGRDNNHTEPVSAMVWGPADRFFTASADRTIKSWPRTGFVPESLRLKVFNQAEDPQETEALSRFFADAYLRYRFTAGLDELQSLGEDAQRRFRSTQETNYEFDPDTLEHLKALGYVE